MQFELSGRGKSRKFSHETKAVARKLRSEKHDKCSKTVVKCGLKTTKSKALKANQTSSSSSSPSHISIMPGSGRSLKIK